MELTFEVRRKRSVQQSGDERDELLCLRPVEVEGLDSPTKLERRLSVHLHLRIAEENATEEKSAEPEAQPATKPAVEPQKPAAPPEPEQGSATAEAGTEKVAAAGDEKVTEAAGPEPPSPQQQQETVERQEP